MRSQAYEPKGTEWSVQDGVRFGALLSADKRHRYTLTREWDASKPRLLWIGLNPANADFETADPSSERVVQRAKLDNFGRIDVGNLWSYRSTTPADLPISGAVGPDTDLHLAGMIAAADMIVVGWGSTLVKGKAVRVAQVLALLANRDLYTYGTLTYGDPEHPKSRRFTVPPKPTLWLAGIR